MSGAPESASGLRPAGTERALGSRYVLEHVLGAGAMGEVWSARDDGTGERVAAKLLRPELTRDPQVVARFVQERSILLALEHPGVVRVRDLVVEGDDLAIVMDLVEGTDLRCRLRAERTLPPAEAVATVADVLDALAAAHAGVVLHRDVKPDNVLLQRPSGDAPGRVLLTDFGIARLAQGPATRMTGVLGTVEYLAPEVLTGAAVGAAADVYGAGTTLYELLAGRTPFAGEGSAYAVVHRHVTAEPPPLPGLPAPLAAELAALLDKDPDRRPAAGAAAASLRALLPGLAGLQALAPQPQPAWETALETGPAVRVRGADAEVADPQQTLLRGLPAAPAAAGPLAAPVGPSAPLAVPDDEVVSGQTQLRPQRVRRLVDPAQAPPDEVAPRRLSGRRRTALLVAAGVAGAAVLVGALVLLLGRGGADGPATALPALELSAALEQHASGLTVQRSASYDAGKGLLTTTIAFTSTSGTLLGPLFEAAPPARPGGPCPTVSWADTPALRDTTIGIDGDACGWQLTVPPVAAGSPVTVHYAQPLRLSGGDDPEQVVRDHLDAEATATTTALEQLSASPAYPVQRLESLSVQVGTAPVVSSRIDLTVAPLWSGSDTPDLVDQLYSSASPEPTDLLRQLGGTLAVTSEDCSGAVGFTDRVPYSNTVAQSCTITARLGALTAESRSFDIALNSTS